MFFLTCAIWLASPRSAEVPAVGLDPQPSGQPARKITISPSAGRIWQTLSNHVARAIATPKTADSRRGDLWANAGRDRDFSCLAEVEMLVGSARRCPRRKIFHCGDDETMPSNPRAHHRRRDCDIGRGRIGRDCVARPAKNAWLNYPNFVHF